MIFGWGNGGNGWGGFGGNTGSVGTQFTDAALQRGFDNQTVIGKLDGINAGLCDGFYAVNTSLLNGFNGVQRDMCTGFANINAGINENRFAAQQCCCDVERAIDNSRFATQTGLNAIGTQLASCCCETNRSIERGFADTNYNLATQICAVQTQMANNTRDIIDSQQSGTRAILDYLCQEKIADLQQENQTLRLAASQERQNNYLVNTLRPMPTPAYLSCNPWAASYGYGAYGLNGYNGFNNNGCGCGCGCNG